MFWGVIWLLATAGTLVAKFLTTREVARLRRDLARLQKEYASARLRTEEARDVCAYLSRQEREKIAESERLRRTLAKMEEQLRKHDEQPETEEEQDAKKRLKPRRLGDHGAQRPI